MRLPTIIWSLIGLTLLAVGGSRIMAGLGDQETQVRRQVAAMVESLAKDGRRGIGRFISRSYIDEDTGIELYELRNALRESARDLSPEFDPQAGIEFLPTEPSEDEEDEVCTIRVSCLLMKTPRNQPPRPYWDLKATLDLRKERGSWKVLCSRDVNHADRGRL